LLTLSITTGKEGVEHHTNSGAEKTDGERPSNGVGVIHPSDFGAIRPPHVQPLSKEAVRQVCSPIQGSPFLASEFRRSGGRRRRKRELVWTLWTLAPTLPRARLWRSNLPRPGLLICRFSGHLSVPFSCNLGRRNGPPLLWGTLRDSGYGHLRPPAGAGACSRSTSAGL